MLIIVFLPSLIRRKKICKDQEQNKKKTERRRFFFFFPQTTTYSDFSCSQVLQLEEFCRIEEREWSVTAN